MTIYKINYMHGDADGYSNKTFEVKGNVKNKLIKSIINIYNEVKPEWRCNFLKKIDNESIENYFYANYNEKDKTSELLSKIKSLLRKNRARNLYDILKETNESDGFYDFEIEYINRIISIDFDSPENEENFYDEIFETCMELIEDYNIFESDISCEDRYANILKIEIKESYYDEILKKLDSLSTSELKDLKDIIDKKLS